MCIKFSSAHLHIYCELDLVLFFICFLTSQFLASKAHWLRSLLKLFLFCWHHVLMVGLGGQGYLCESVYQS